jgi:hypothetical protein
MVSLEEIASRYDTDKVAHPHDLSSYENCFAEFRGKEIRLLELGIKSGGSLLLWRDYFERGLIVGLDINPIVLDQPGIRTYEGKQHDTKLLDRIAKESAPEGFDVIIDDCSHIGVLARASFWHLFDHHLKSGGVYVVEDWGTGYWDSWVDGIGYNSWEKPFSQAYYRLTRILARLWRHPIAQRMPLIGKALSKTKALMVKRQYHSHDYGMVGFIKELVDELGMAAISHPQFGTIPPRSSKFREIRISPSHLLITKA